MNSPSYLLRAAILGALLASLLPRDLSAQKVHIQRVNGKAGIGQIIPGRWGLLAVDVVNSSDKPVEARVSLQFQEVKAEHRFVRQIWIPEKSLRRAWIPVRMPKNVPDGATYVEVRAYLYEVGVTGVSGSSDEIYHTFRVPIERENNLSVLVADHPKSDRDELYRIVLNARRTGKQGARLARVHDLELPPLEEGFDSASQVILATKNIEHDSAGRQALRQWVLGGGKLWIMMDRVGPDTVKLLLGDAFPAYVVDETKLREVLITDTDPNVDKGDEQQRPVFFDEPVDFVRVLPEGMQVTHKVGEWPAAMWTKMGKGEVLITTLEARSWIKLKDSSLIEMKSDLNLDHAQVLPPLAKLARRFFKPRAALLVPPKLMESYLDEQIGYEIASRTQVGVILLGFCGVLLVGGVFLASRDQTGRLGIVAPAAAVLGVIALFIIGAQSRSAVEPTVAMLQVIHAQPGGEQLEVRGLMAIYESEKQELASKTTHGGTFRVDLSNLNNDARFVWTSINQWQWENLSLPPGTRFAPFRGQVIPAKPIHATISFDDKGMIGDMTTGSLTIDNDLVVLHSPSTPNLGVRFADGKLNGTLDDVLPEDRLILASPLSEEQRRRQEVMRTALQESKTFPQQTTLAVWCQNVNLGFQFPGIDQRRGASLVLIPVNVLRPKEGSKVAIPATFLSYSTYPGPGGRSESTAFNRTTGKWVEVRVSSKAWLKVRPPENLRPIQVEKLTVHLNISAPGRDIEIQGHDGSKAVVLHTLNSPSGLVSFDLTQQERLQLDKDGNLVLAINFKRPSNLESAGVRANIEPALIKALSFTMHGEIPKADVAKKN